MSKEKETGVCALFGYKLKKTQHSLRLHMDEGLRALELTTPQYAVLARAELEPGISNAALARAAFITAQSMHGIVSKLEERGLIQRKSDPRHGRILSSELTEKGREVVAQAHKIIQACEARMLMTLSEAQRELLENLLLECFRNLNPADPDSGPPPPEGHKIWIVPE